MPGDAVECPNAATAILRAKFEDAVVLKAFGELSADLATPTVKKKSRRIPNLAAQCPY